MFYDQLNWWTLIAWLTSSWFSLETDIVGMSVKSLTTIFKELIKVVVVVLNPISLERYLYIVKTKQLVILIMT